MNILKMFGIQKMPMYMPRDFPGHGIKHSPDFDKMTRHPMDKGFGIAHVNQHLNPTVVHGQHGPKNKSHAWMEYDHPETGETMVYDPTHKVMGTQENAYNEAVYDGRSFPAAPDWYKQPLLNPRHRYDVSEVTELWDTHGHSGPFSREERSTIPRLQNIDNEEAAGMPPRD